MAGLSEVLLEGKVSILEAGTGGDQLTYGLHHSEVSALIGTLLGDEGVVAVSHHGAELCMLLLHGNLCGHGLNRGSLVLSAEGHQDSARTDGGIEALTETALGADIKVSCQLFQVLSKAALNLLMDVLRLLGLDRDVLLCTVGVQELTGQVQDHLAVPVHDQPVGVGDIGHMAGFQIFLLRQLHETGLILRCHHNCHSFLRLGNGQLCAVQTLVLLRYLVQVNVQTVSQLTDGHGYTAGTEVVAALDETACLRIPEQALQLSLLRCITLLHLGTAAVQRLQVMGLGGAGGTADTVASGTSAQKDNHVTGGRHLTPYIFCRSGCHNGADLHALCGIARMIDLIHKTGSQTDLVAVG